MYSEVQQDLKLDPAVVKNTSDILNAHHLLKDDFFPSMHSCDFA